MRILFIGNSHTYFNDMPHLCAELLRASGKDVEVTMLTRGGETLHGHILSEQTRFNILFGHYDWVILQEATGDFPSKAQYMADVTVLKGWCDEVGSRAALYMNFESPKGTPPLAPLRNAVCEAGSLLYLPVARAGEAFARAEAECPEIDRYFTDRHHASPAGSYLIALMIAKDVFGVDPKGLPDLSLPPETAAKLRRIAAEL